MNINNNPSKWILYLVALIFAATIISFPPANIFSYDVFGYYMYLPLTFNYHDVLLHDPAIIQGIFSKYKISETFYQAFNWEGTQTWVMRYPIGPAVLYAPFYFSANLICRFSHFPNDGFSEPYQVCILIGCYGYTLFGLSYLRKILLFFFKDLTVAVTLFVIAIGTNYFFHTGMHGQGAMSHNLLFFLIASLIYYTICWHRNAKLKYALLIGCIAGLIVITRATEIIILIIPLLYGVSSKLSLKEKINILFKQRLQVIATIGIFFIVILLQAGYWKYATNKFYVNTYGSSNPGEGLELLHPHILEILFSFRKGLFIYVPIMFFAFLGFFKSGILIKPLKAGLIFYSIASIYIVSCWSCWWYGSCFGNRALIPLYVGLTFPLASFFEKGLFSRYKFLLAAILLILISLNLFQSWQINKGILDSTNMSRAYYVSTFLQTKQPSKEQKKLLLKGKFDTGIEVFTKDDSLSHQVAQKKCIDISTSEKEVSAQDTISSIVTVNNVSKKSYFWIRSCVTLVNTSDTPGDTVILGVLMRHKGYIFKNMSLKIGMNKQVNGILKNYVFYYFVPDDLRSKKDQIEVYFINTIKHPVSIKNFCFEVLEPIVDKSVF